MSVFSVFEIIGKGIEDLRRENENLKHEIEQLRTSREFAFNRLCEVEREQDELQLKLKTVQDYADSLAQEIEESIDFETKTLRALKFGEPEEIFDAHECEKASMSEKTEESGC